MEKNEYAQGRQSSLVVCTIYSFCSGFGMLESGIQVALEARGIECLVVGYCEREAGAASALVARMAQEEMGQAPVAGDMATFDGRPWRGRVDIICAGLPCQPYSVAGKQKGNTDHRSLGNDDGPVAHFLRIVDEMQPAIIFLENVPPWITQGHFYPVGERLCELGYQIEDPFFLASQDVGANHKRERVFIMAYRESERAWPIPARSRGEGIGETDPDGFSEDLGNGHLRSGRRQCSDETRSEAVQSGPEIANPELADAGESGFQGNERGGALHDQEPTAHGSTSEFGSNVGDSADPERRQGEQGEQGKTQIGRDRFTDTDIQLPRYAFGRDDWDNWAIVAGLDPTRMPSIESELSVVADGLAFSNDDLLRIGGNGVDPLVAAVAFGVLFDRVVEIGTTGK